jgi:hypothetical protein
VRTVAARAALDDHEAVSTSGRQDDPSREQSTAADATSQPQEKHRNWWMWISAVLGIVAVGLLVWALSVKSDGDGTQQQLDSTQKELASTKQQLDSAQQTPTPTPTPTEQESNAVGVGLAAGAFATMKRLYDDLTAELDTAQDDLAATQDDLQKANDAAAKAEQNAAAADEKASQASNETEKAKAEADKAKAEAEAAKSKGRVVADCAKAYISAFGDLFQGGGVEEQAPAVRQAFEQISAQCKTALAEA